MARVSGIIILGLTQLLTFVTWCVFIGSLSSMQHTLNALNLAASTAKQTAYTNTFNGALWINYAGHPRRQFGYQWWYSAYQIFVLFWALCVCMGPRLLQRGRSTTQALLVVALSMGINICNSTLFLSYSPDAVYLFGSSTINAVFSGAIILSVANFISIFALGLAPSPDENQYIGTPPHSTQGPKQMYPADGHNGNAMAV